MSGNPEVGCMLIVFPLDLPVWPSDVFGRVRGAGRVHLIDATSAVTPAPGINPPSHSPRG